MTDHKHGEMNTDAQVRTFSGFLKATKWLTGVSIGILVFLAIFNS